MEVISESDGWRPTPPSKSGRMSKTAYVVDVTIRQAEAEKYPCGWDYGLHLWEVGGDTILRYDNAHERTKGHERHTRDDDETIQFLGMLTLYDRSSVTLKN